MMTLPTIAIASPYDSYRLPFNGPLYAFCKIAAEVAQADLVAPPGRYEKEVAFDMVSPLDKARAEARRGISTLRHRLGLPRLPTIRPTRLSKRYDVFAFICSFMHDLPNLHAISGWERSGLKIAFLMESWTNLIPAHRRTLAMLDAFDHVFVLNRTSLPMLARYTSTPASFLPLAADAVLSVPSPMRGERPIDVYSMGRRAPVVHRQLAEAARAGRIFYMHDTTAGGGVLDWAESRTMNASLIKRSRYFVAFDHTIGSALKNVEAKGETALSARYFEGAAGGTVMIGSAPSCPEFAELFDWPDALVPIPAEPDDVLAILGELDRQPERTARIRRENVVQSLARHDWSHRWDAIARVLALPQTPAFVARKNRLAHLAESLREAAFAA